MTKAEKATRRRRADAERLIVDMLALKGRAGELGLFRTMHAIDDATRAVGWELADLIERKRL